MPENMDPASFPIDNLPPSQSKFPFSPSLILLSLLLLGLVAVAFGYVFIYQPSTESADVTKPVNNLPLSPTPQPQPTLTNPDPSVLVPTGWLSFNSPQLGIAFAYPADYDPPMEQSGYLSLLSPIEINEDKNYMLQNNELKIEIVKEASKPNDSPQQCRLDHTLGESTILSQSEIIVDGVVTENVVWEGMGTGQFICVIKNNFRYLINKYPAQTSRQAEFDQFLASFKILDQDLTMSHTFLDTNFSVSYPDDGLWQTGNSGSAVYCQSCSPQHTIDMVMLNPVIYTSIGEYLEKDTLSTQYEKITLDGLEAVKGVQPGGPQAGGSFQTYFFVYNGQGYLITERYPSIMDAQSFTDFPPANPAIMASFKVK